MALEDQTTDISYFSLDGYETTAKIVKVYDGDTVHAVFKMFDKYYKWNCRILHVDTPELRTKDLEEKKRGYECKEKLCALILDKIVLLNCSKFDKYGRLLVEITVPETGVKIHEYLISEGLANKYEGKTKEKWDFSNEGEAESKAEKPKVEKVVKPKVEKAEKPKVEKPKVEKAEKPKAEKVVKPKVEKAETPKVEA
jgi:endonuclease YncB( thermonuclease family)